jgi:glycosyltransferase involved in cell wall biosynthesis
MISSKKPRILFVHPDPSERVTGFIEQDILFLRQWYDVDALSVNTTAFDSYRRALRSRHLWRMVWEHDAVFAWFGGRTTPMVVMASILRKPSVIVAGGGDVVSLPEIGYGLRKNDKRAFFLQTLGFRLAKKILTFSESSRWSVLDLPGVDAKRVQTAYLAVDTTRFFPGARAKKPQVLTLGEVKESNLWRKGFLTFLEAARRMPEVTFRLGGQIKQPETAERIKRLSPPNLVFLGDLSEQQLVCEYQDAMIYAQLSLHEGFGMALAEAMACECVPVVTHRGALREVVGSAGLYVPPDDPDETGNAISRILAGSCPDLGQSARKRIVECFPLSKREEQLRRAMEGIFART